jgi:peroxiredoxin
MSDFPTAPLRVGQSAPDFTLRTHNEGELNLGWYRGRKNVVLAFYPGDWTPVCAQQIPGLQAVVDRFDACNCQLLAISVDSVYCHGAWAKTLGGLSFPLMSDYYPHGAVARQYGVLNELGYAERSFFAIDIHGSIQYIDIVPPAEMPEIGRLFEALASFPSRPAD